jgi:AcrR family transcriptional regulator
MRKLPRQARSRATVEAILEAGARILNDDGWAGFATNGVAERAGVSIGSLYQYFPDKLSLVDAIRRRHLDDCLAVMRRSKDGRLDPAQFAAQLVRAMTEAHSSHPGLHRALLDETPKDAEYRNPDSAFEREYLDCIAQALAPYRQGAVDGNIRIAALIVSDAIDGVIHNAVRRGMLGDTAVQHELVRLLTLYLADARGDPG